MGVTTVSEAVVMAFMHALEAKDHEKIAELLAPDLHYINVSLPAIIGGQRVANLFEVLLRRGTGFSVQVHSLAVNRDVVLTERTDMIKVGSLHIAFWVCGTFRVQDGKIILWRDYFDWFDIAKGVLRGIAGIVVPKYRVVLPQ